MTLNRFDKSTTLFYNLLFAFLLLSTGIKAASWPTKSWVKGDPSSAGMNLDSLEAYSNTLKSGALGYIDGMLITRNGKIIFENRNKNII